MYAIVKWIRGSVPNMVFTQCNKYAIRTLPRHIQKEVTFQHHVVVTRFIYLFLQMQVFHPPRPRENLAINFSKTRKTGKKWIKFSGESYHTWESLFPTSTMDAASDAAFSCDPVCRAIPTSASASEGASFMPSPT